jgi:phosphoribosylanthranilate isomerase
MDTKTILVKSITSLSEARYCSGMMVDYISFDLNPNSVDYVSKTDFDEIKNWLSGVKILGSYDTSDVFEVIEALNNYTLDGFIFSESQKSMLDELEVLEKFLEISDADNFEINFNLNYVILKGKNLGIWTKEYNVLVGYDFENIDKEFSDIAGYAFNGSKELRPGINNYDGLMETLEKLEDRN